MRKVVLAAIAFATVARLPTFTRLQAAAAAE
jgi:hypothetical protein